MASVTSILLCLVAVIVGIALIAFGFSGIKGKGRD